MGISVGLIGKNDNGFKFYRKEIKLFLDEIAHQNPLAKSFHPGVTGKLDKRLFPEKMTPLQLHSLRRYAAHLELNNSPPSSPMSELDTNPSLDEVRKGQITLEELQKILVNPEMSTAYFLSHRNIYQGDPVLEKFYSGFHSSKKYAHLISDEDHISRHYFPIDFARPIAINKHSRSEHTMVGSSQRLLVELNELNAYLKVPDIDLTDTKAYYDLLERLLENDPWIYEKEAWMIFYMCAKESVLRNLIISFG
jgi:hypothetical protein